MHVSHIFFHVRAVVCEKIEKLLKTDHSFKKSLKHFLNLQIQIQVHFALRAALMCLQKLVLILPQSMVVQSIRLWIQAVVE